MSADEDEEEDDNAELLNQNIELKFMKTIVDLQSGIIPETPVFQDEDFHVSIKEQSKPILTYNQTITAKPTDQELIPLFKKEQEQTRNAFIKAAEPISNEEEGENIFVKKPTQSIEKEDIDNAKFDEIMQKQKKYVDYTIDSDVLKKYWETSEAMSKDDKFLRNYLLSYKWKDEGRVSYDKTMKQIDEEDENRDDEMEDYENKYNFKYNDGTGKFISSDSRNVEDTYRQKDSKRSEKRKEKEKRKKKEKTTLLAKYNKPQENKIEVKEEDNQNVVQEECDGEIERQNDEEGEGAEGEWWYCDGNTIT